MIHHKTIKKIRDFALYGGGMYRMNCKTATCYAFRILPRGSKNLDGTINKKADFTGGWDWINEDGIVLCDKRASHYIRLSDGKLYENKVQ